MHVLPHFVPRGLRVSLLSLSLAATALAFQSSLRADTLYVSETGANDVRAYQAPNVFISSTTANLNAPVGVALDAVGNVFTVNNGNASVAKLSSTLGSPSYYVAPGAGNGLNAPVGMTFDGNGNAYVTNQGTYAGQISPQAGAVTMYNSAGTLLTTFALGSSRAPAGIAYASFANPSAGAGYNLYVAESATNTLNIYNTVTIALAAVVLAPSGALALNSPAGVAVDIAHSLVYVVNAGLAGINAGTVEMYNALTNTFSIFASGGLLSQPRGIAVDSAGNVFVSNGGNGTIVEFNSLGNSLGTYASGLNQPGYLATGPNLNGPVSPVPESGPTAALLCLGFLGLTAQNLVWKRRRQAVPQ